MTRMTRETVGLLAMAMGTPAGLEDVEAYYTHIRGGRSPAPALVEELRARYAAIGGRSPLLEISRAQAEGVAARLARLTGTPVRAYLGMKHSAPFVADAVAAMRADGVRRALGLALAPHPSALVSDEYRAHALRAIAAGGGEIAFEMIAPWHLHPGFLACLAGRARAALAAFPAAERERVHLLFTAHSLPLRVVSAGDPYPGAVRATAGAVALRVGHPRWSVCWQSAGRTPEPWLGPDVAAVLPELAATGSAGVVVCPIGFVADHLEVLYDIDVQARAIADGLGLRLERARSMNDDPVFIAALADVAEAALARPVPA